MNERLMGPSQGKSMPETSMAINSALDASGNLIYRISPGVYKKAAASGYPEVYLKASLVNIYKYWEYLIVSVAFQGGYSSTGPIPEHSYVYFKSFVSSDESVRTAGHPYVIGVGQPGGHSDSNILNVNMLSISKKTGQNYQEYTALSNLLIVYSSTGKNLGDTINSGEVFNLNSGVYMLAKL